METRLIRSTLRNCAKGSSPGDDCISYFYLWNLSASHSFPQLFSTILLESNRCPPSWCKGKIVLIHNYRAISAQRIGSLPLFVSSKGHSKGDTLSPFIFLLAVSPILHLASTWSHQGFLTQIAIPNSEDLLPKGATVYILWDELDTSEPVGWYRTVIVDCHPDGSTLVEYSNGSTENLILDLRSTPWELTQKNVKCFVKPSDHRAPPPKSSHPKSLKYACSKEHKVTAFADDMSIISSPQDDRQSAFLDIDNACSSVSPLLKPRPLNVYPLLWRMAPPFQTAPSTYLMEPLGASQRGLPNSWVRP